MYEPAWCRALNDLGIFCEIFDAHTYTPPGILGRVERRVLWGPGIRRLRKALIAKVADLRPDATLLYQGHYFDAQTVEALKALTFVTGYHNDDPFGSRAKLFRYRFLSSALRHYDAFHVYRPINEVDAQRLGIPRVGRLMPYYLPWLDYPRALNSDDLRKWGADVVFAGHVEHDIRVDCLAGAVRAGHKVRIHGEGKYWGRALPKEIYETLCPINLALGEDYRKALCASKIAAAFFSKWNRDVYTRRSFEIPACGAFLMAERTPEMREIFREGEEAEYFSSLEEFLEKVTFYLRNHAVRERVARKGLERVRESGHDIHSRMRQWCADVGAWMNTKI